MSNDRSIFAIPLIREISMILVLKLVIIFLIKAAYFSTPVDMSDATTVMSSQLGLDISERASVSGATPDNVNNSEVH